MFGTIWNDFLYQPLFNVLIWMYNNWTDQNLGWAIVYLTVLLRVVLLPFTIIAERDRIKNEKLTTELRGLAKEYRNDPVMQKDEIRRRLRQKRVRPWAKVVVLGIQVLVLVLLYQVFLRGITGEKLIRFLYSWVDFPGRINTMFYGFNLGKVHDVVWPGAVGLFLLAEIYWDYRKHKRELTKSDLFYFIIFPLFSFFILWILPMVKSLFIMTSLLFSVIIRLFVNLLFKPASVPKK